MSIFRHSTVAAQIHIIKLTKTGMIASRGLECGASKYGVTKYCSSDALLLGGGMEGYVVVLVVLVW